MRRCRRGERGAVGDWRGRGTRGTGAGWAGLARASGGRVVRRSAPGKAALPPPFLSSRAWLDRVDSLLFWGWGVCVCARVSIDPKARRPLLLRPPLDRPNVKSHTAYLRLPHRSIDSNHLVVRCCARQAQGSEAPPMHDYMPPMHHPIHSRDPHPPTRHTHNRHSDAPGVDCWAGGVWFVPG